MGKLLWGLGLFVLFAGLVFVSIGPKDDDVQNYAPPIVLGGLVLACTGMVVHRLDKLLSRTGGYGKD